MNGELWGIGRGYVMAFVVLIMVFVLVLVGKVTADAFLSFIQIFAPIMVGIKEGGGAVKAWAESKKTGGETNGTN